MANVSLISIIVITLLILITIWIDETAMPINPLWRGVQNALLIMFILNLFALLILG